MEARNKYEVRRWSRKVGGQTVRSGFSRGAEALAEGAGAPVSGILAGGIGARAVYSSRQHANALSTKHQVIYGYPAEPYSGQDITTVKTAISYVVMKKNRKAGHRGVDATLKVGTGVASTVVGGPVGTVLGMGIGGVPAYLYRGAKNLWKRANRTLGEHRYQASEVLWNKGIESFQTPSDLRDPDHHMALFACEEILGSAYYDLAVDGYNSGDRALGAKLIKDKLKSW